MTGCNLEDTDLFKDREPYDVDFKDAHEFAEYWCGPCKEVDSYKVNGLIAHEMKDKEWGFTYIVYEGYYERGDTGIMDVYYTAETFSYYYLETFIEESDLDEYLDENGLTLDCGEIHKWDTGVLSYSAELNVRTDRTLTDDDAKEISTTVIDALADSMTEISLQNPRTHRKYSLPSGQLRGIRIPRLAPFITHGPAYTDIPWATGRTEPYPLSLTKRSTLLVISPITSSRDFWPAKYAWISSLTISMTAVSVDGM